MLSEAMGQLQPPGGLPQVLGPTGAILQAFQMIMIVPTLPSIESLWRDVEVAAGFAVSPVLTSGWAQPNGEAGIPIVLVIVHPLQPLPGLLG